MSGIFGDQALRLLRDDWPDAQTLAEELYAIFTSTTPTTLQGPVTINNSSNQPDLTTNNYGSGPGGITINKQPFPGPPLPPGGSPIEFGNITFTSYFSDGSSSGTNGGSSGASQPPQQSASAFPAMILSGGPGATYQVSVYKNGPTGAATAATATQLQIDSGETIPVGTWTIVTLVNNKYYMQVPVWLDDLT